MSQLQGYVTAEDNPRTAEMEAGSETRLGQPIVRAILKAGLAVIGKLGANSGVDIGDVTVNNAAGSGAYVQPGTSTTWDVSDRAARDLGKVDVAGFDQYTPVSGRLPVDGSGVTQPVSGTVTADQGAAGAAAWPVSEADGANVAIGAVADAAVTTDTTGTLSGKLRGLVALMVNLLSRWPAALGGGGGLSVDVAPVTAAAADVNAPAVNTAAVVTYGAAATTRHVITGVAWSYVGGIPTGGNLTITDAGATVFNIDIAEEGPGFFSFPSPKRSALVNTAMVITLAAGGAGITGKLSMLNHFVE